MAIIAISSTKGGPGKTTLVGCLADYWSKQGKRVALLDTDPNQNLSSWFRKKRDKAFEGVKLITSEDDDTIIKDARKLSEENEIVIIDVAGVSSKSLLYAAGVADLVVIPSQPSEDDLVEAIKTHRIVANAEEMVNRKIACRLVLTRVRQGTQVLEHSLQQLLDVKLPVFKSVIADRTIYQKARFSGTTPIRLEPSGAASSDIEDLSLEIEDIVKISEKKIKVKKAS